MHTDYWKRWLNASEFEKEEMVTELKICGTLANLIYPKLNREDSINLIAMLLNRYLRDLQDAIELENNPKGSVDKFLKP